MEMIHTDKAPAAIGPYSQAVVSNGMLYTSGQIPLDPKTGELVDGGIAEQAQQAMKNLEAVAQAAGCTLENAVKVNCYLSDMSLFEEFNKVYAEFFTGKPARSCVAVKTLPRNALVEIELTAEIPGKQNGAPEKLSSRKAIERY